MNDNPDWLPMSLIGNVTADELSAALAMRGIRFTGVMPNDEDRIMVFFEDLVDAETMLTLTVQGEQTSGSLYDRASDMCVTMSESVDNETEYTDEQIEELTARGWTWLIHPAMNGRRVTWHVRADIPMGDAAEVTARLNALHHGGAV